MDTSAKCLVDSLKKICKREGLKVYESRGGRCSKHSTTLERSGAVWLCWDCQLELATYASSSADEHNRKISADAAKGLFGPAY